MRESRPPLIWPTLTFRRISKLRSENRRSQKGPTPPRAFRGGRSQRRRHQGQTVPFFGVGPERNVTSSPGLVRFTSLAWAESTLAGEQARPVASSLLLGARPEQEASVGLSAVSITVDRTSIVARDAEDIQWAPQQGRPAASTSPHPAMVWPRAPAFVVPQVHCSANQKNLLFSAAVAESVETGSIGSAGDS